MLEVQNVMAHCPYCGEPIHLLIDCSVDQQRYTEDCEVCCRPMIVDVSVSPSGDADVTLFREDD